MKTLRTRNRRGGQVMVIAPVLLLAVAAVMALTADIGRIVLERTRLQNGCDAAAVAGAHVLLGQQAAGMDEAQCRALAAQDAIAIFRANSVEAGVTVEFGYKGADGSFIPAAEAVRAALVRATGVRDEDAPAGMLPMIIAGLAGVHETRVETVAVAEIGESIRAVTANLSPFAIPEARVPAVDEVVVFYPGDYDAYAEGLGTDTVVPGNWGLLNLDGGDLGTPELIDWIENGTGSLDIPPEDEYLWIGGTSGFRAALDKTISDKIGEPMIVVIYDTVVGNGANASFRAVGFMSVTIVDCVLVGKDPFASCRVDAVYTLHDVITGGGYVSNMRKVQLII